MRTRHALWAFVLLTSAFTLGARAEARADVLSASSALTDAINNLRISLGIAPLAVDPSLSSVAQGWSQQMAQADDISHNPELGSEAPAGWRLLGENTGTGPDLAAVGQGLLASPEHYANMVDPYFNVVGVAAATGPSGTLFVTEDFMEAPAAAPAARSSAPVTARAAPVPASTPPASPSVPAASSPVAPAAAHTSAPAPPPAPTPPPTPTKAGIGSPAVVVPATPPPAPLAQSPAEPALAPPARPSAERTVRTAGSSGAPYPAPVPSLPGALAGAAVAGVALSVLRVLQARRPRPTW